MDELLNEVDVTDIAENDESLKAKYKAEVSYLPAKAYNHSNISNCELDLLRWRS